MEFISFVMRHILTNFLVFWHCVLIPFIRTFTYMGFSWVFFTICFTILLHFFCRDSIWCSYIGIIVWRVGRWNILYSWFRASLQFFQNKNQQDDSYALPFIWGLVVLYSTWFELQGTHHQELHFSTLYRQSLAHCIL